MRLWLELDPVKVRLGIRVDGHPKMQRIVYYVLTEHISATPPPKTRLVSAEIWVGFLGFRVSKEVYVAVSFGERAVKNGGFHG